MQIKFVSPEAEERNIRESAAAVDAELRRRTEAGWQCPECYGVRISPRQTRFDSSPNGFQCEECGCQWGART